MTDGGLLTHTNVIREQLLYETARRIVKYTTLNISRIKIENAKQNMKQITVSIAGITSPVPTMSIAHYAELKEVK